MAKDIHEFLTNWVSENVHPVAYEPEGDNTESTELAAQCVSAARSEGISKVDLEAFAGDMTDYMAEQIDEFIGREIDRRMAKED